MLPTLSYENNTYTFTLWRDGKEVVHKFGDFSVTINEKHETIINGVSSVQIHTSPEACDGNFYYIYIEPFQGENIRILLSKEEFDILDPILIDIEEEKFERYEHEFTRTTLKNMDKNPSEYGPEQLTRAMVSCPICGDVLAGSVYRPHCPECDWDLDAAFREHPLNHE